MARAANESIVTPRSARVGSLTIAIAIAGAALLAGCSGSASRTARHAGTTAHPTASTTTTTAPKTKTKTTTTPSVTYRVKRGDRLTTIARRFRVSIPAIVFVNHLADPDRLAEGQVLRIPTHPPLTLIVTPSKGPPGQRFVFNLIGSKPSEVIRFRIDSPGGKSTGPPHIASKDGTVTTGYKTSLVNRAGTYKVIANGNKGSTTRATFVVVKGR